MSRPSPRTCEARNNPEVIRKLESLRTQWTALSKADRTARIQELTALKTPNTVIADGVGKKESTIRYYDESASQKEATAVTAPRQVKPSATLKVPAIKLDVPFEVPVRPVLSWGDQVKKACVNNLRDSGQSDRFVLETLDFVQQRCDQWQYCGDMPRPVAHEVSPAAVFGTSSAKGEEFDPFAPVEHIAVCLLQLLPMALERDRLLRELRAEFTPGR